MLVMFFLPKFSEPPSFLIEPTNTMVDQGQTARMDCVGFGEPEPKMDWMIGWDILKDEGRLSILPNNSLRYYMSHVMR